MALVEPLEQPADGLGAVAGTGVIIGTPCTIQVTAGGAIQVYAGAGLSPSGFAFHASTSAWYAFTSSTHFCSVVPFGTRA